MSVEWIKYRGESLALIISSNYNPSKTTFITPLEYKQQLGYIVYKKEESITPHIHIPMTRSFIGTSEVLFLKSGKVQVNFYSKDKIFITSRILNKGDIILLISGGHGFKMLEDSVMVEVKQGPYLGKKEKERFNLNDSSQ